MRRSKLLLVFVVYVAEGLANWRKAPEMAEKFERHKQAWTTDEVQKLHTLAKKGMPLRAIAKALTRSEESVKARAKADKLGIAALR
jgi:DNA-binding NarL/FixJ family response regulator